MFIPWVVTWISIVTLFETFFVVHMNLKLPYVHSIEQVLNNAGNIHQAELHYYNHKELLLTFRHLV